jgi:hypothetical protein
MLARPTARGKHFQIDVKETHGVDLLSQRRA